jgi:hypothetical protein
MYDPGKLQTMYCLTEMMDYFPNYREAETGTNKLLMVGQGPVQVHITPIYMNQLPGGVTRSW